MEANGNEIGGVVLEERGEIVCEGHEKLQALRRRLLNEDNAFPLELEGGGAERGEAADATTVANCIINLGDESEAPESSFQKTSRPSTAEKENVANEFSKLEKAVTTSPNHGGTTTERSNESGCMKRMVQTCQPPEIFLCSDIIQQEDSVEAKLSDEARDCATLKLRGHESTSINDVIDGHIQEEMRPRECEVLPGTNKNELGDKEQFQKRLLSFARTRLLFREDGPPLDTRFDPPPELLKKRSQAASADEASHKQPTNVKNDIEMESYTYEHNKKRCMDRKNRNCNPNQDLHSVQDSIVDTNARMCTEDEWFCRW